MILNTINTIKTDKHSLSVLYRICEFIILSFNAFIAWNFFGPLFILNLGWLFFQLWNSINKLKLWADVLIFTSSWIIGSLIWMINLDKGIYALFICFFCYSFFLRLIVWVQNKMKLNVFFLIPCWLSIEFIFNWMPISFTWLTLGNCLSNQVWLIPWYRFTGVQGGSLLILLSAYVVILYIKTKTKPYWLFLGILLFAMILVVNLNINQTTKKITDEERCVVVTNLIHFPKIRNKERFLSNILREIPKDSEAHLLLPELTIRGLDNKGFKKSKTYRLLKNEMKKSNFRSISLGTTGVRSNGILVNSALSLDQKGNVFYKRKNRLVPYTEYIPSIFHSFFSKSFYDYVFPDDSEEIKSSQEMSLHICYEAFYPYYITHKSQGARFIGLLSSERFMNNSTLGKKQYNNIIKLRAIENNIPLVKSAFDGISMIISPMGNTILASDEPFTFFNFSIPKQVSKTWFSKYGIHCIWSVIFVLFGLSFWINSKETL